MKKLALIFTAALLVCSCGQKANEADKALIASLDSLFTADYAADGPGAAVIVLRGNDVIFDKGYGVADLGTGAKIEGNTFFNIASMSKQFTAVAIMQLAEQGLLSVTESLSDPTNIVIVEWADTIKNFLPENRLKIEITYTDNNEREVIIKNPTDTKIKESI